MSGRKIKRSILLSACLSALLLLTTGASHAQQASTVITLAVPELLRDTYERVTQQYEADHPGIDVVIVTYGGFQSALNTNQDIEDYLDDVADFVSSADVLSVDSSSILPEATTAGYFLDLAPLASADPLLNVDDFYPGAWQSFHWNGGIWGLPIAANTHTLYYDPQAFDAAGIAYPDESWSLNDLEYAIRTLAQTDSTGAVTAPAMLALNADYSTLLLSLLGDNVVDETTNPAMPDFSNPDLETLLTTWAELEAAGYITFPQTAEFDINSTPILIGPSLLAQGFGGPQAQQQSQRVGRLFPGGRAGVSATGFAISAGTQSPDAAYALARYLTMNIEVAASSFDSIPARRSLVGEEVPQSQPGERGPSFSFGSALSPEAQALAENALEVGISTGEALFASDLLSAISSMNADNLDFRTALQDAENAIITRTNIALERRSSLNITVATPLRESDLAPGEIALNFGASSFISPFPNADRWQQIAQGFADYDPEVGFVNLETTMPSGLTEMSQNYDCFYMPSNAVPNADISLLRSLSPLVSTDLNFDRNDFVGTTLDQVSRDNQLWALPITLQPLALRYNPDLFAAAGAVLPAEGWSTSQFEDTLRALQFVTGDTAPFTPQGFGNTYLLMLIAAYGGIPLDYRTSPVTINFTDPATVDAIRQVLDLARDGLIEYSALTGSDGVFTIGPGEARERAIYTETLNGFGFGGGFVIIGGEAPERPANTDLLTTFPRGSQYNAASYDISAAYISASTPHAEACYRFISYLAAQIDLFDGMPARRSQFDNQALVAAQGESVISFYRAQDALLSDINTVTIPTAFSGGSDSFILNYWLNRAFDRYVLEGANLETELAAAEQFTREYQQCSFTITPFEPSTSDPQSFFQQYEDCAVQVDPTYNR